MRVRSGDSSLLGVCELLVGLLFDVLVLSNMLGLSVLLLPCLGLFAFFASAVARFAPALLVLPVGARWVVDAVRTWEFTEEGRLAASEGAANWVVDGGALARVCLGSSRVSKA